MLLDKKNTHYISVLNSSENRVVNRGVTKLGLHKDNSYQECFCSLLLQRCQCNSTILPLQVDHETNTDVSSHPLNDAECKYTLGFYVLY